MCLVITSAFHRISGTSLRPLAQTGKSVYGIRVLWIQDTQICFLDYPSDSACHAAAFHQTIAVPQWLGVAGFTGYVNYAR
jgi:hypothetical protein